LRRSRQRARGYPNKSSKRSFFQKTREPSPISSQGGLARSAAEQTGPILVRNQEAKRCSCRIWTRLQIRARLSKSQTAPPSAQNLYLDPRLIPKAPLSDSYGDSRIAAGLIQVGAEDSRHAISGQIPSAQNLYLDPRLTSTPNAGQLELTRPIPSNGRSGTGLSTEHRAFRRRREGKQSAEAVRKIDALDDTLSTGSRSSLRSFAVCTATKNAAKPLA
jgi:hypothetical protein